MNLRRALASAAATAVLAPLALLSAPAAFADGDPTGTTATGAATTSPSVSASPSASASATASPSPSAPKPAAPEPKKADQEAGQKEEEKAGGEKTVEPSDECTAAEDSPGTLAELRGLPSKIVAGSGWHGFTFRVTNMTDKDFTSARAQVYAFSFAYEDESDTSRYLRLQWFDGAAWRNLDNHVEHGASFPASGPLARGAHADVPLRLAIGAKAPAGAGAALALAVSVDTEGVCGDSVPEDAYWDFDILAAGTSSGQVPPAGAHTGTPKPSATPSASASASGAPSPQASSTPVDGSLASTGAGATLPVFGTAAGLAVVAGAGVVYAVRRRKVGDEA